jgi:hypothetical protein
MATIGRNDRCPCGSGRKYKRCCLDRESELRRRTELGVELLALGSLFPVLRPLDPAAEAWASGAELGRASIESGLELLPTAERERIVRCAEEHCGEAWTGVAAEYGDEAEAEGLLLVGALVGSAQECRDPHRELLAEIELDAVVAVGPVAVLAEVLSCADLWSLPDSIAAAVNADPARVLGAGDLAGELGRAAREMWTEDHERRLRFLVRRIADRPPEPGLTRVPAALAEACSTLEHDEDARLRIAGGMLWDALPDAAAYLAAAA